MWAGDLALRTRRTLTHPLTPVVVLGGAALLAGCLALISTPPVLVAWVVTAVSAGYAISGSV
jgi:hypothetical protein